MTAARVKGRKRHILVDTLGLLIAVLITSAGLDDGSAAPQLLALISATAFPRLGDDLQDNKYHNHDLQAWMATHRPTWRLEVKTRPEGQHRLYALAATLGGGTHQRLERSGS